MKAKHILALIGIVMLLILGICGRYIWIGLEDWASSSDSPSEYPLQQAQAMLDAIATQTIEPDVTAKPWEVGEHECKNLLQKHLLQNNYQYTLTVFSIIGDHGTPFPGGTGSDEVLLRVTFPDGSRVEFDFYISTLLNCREITD